MIVATIEMSPAVGIAKWCGPESSNVIVWFPGRNPVTKMKICSGKSRICIEIPVLLESRFVVSLESVAFVSEKICMILLYNVIFSIFIQLYINKCFELVFDTFIKFSWSLRPAKQQDPIDVRRIWKLLKGALPTPLIWFTSTNTFSLPPQIH